MRLTLTRTNVHNIGLLIGLLSTIQPEDYNHEWYGTTAEQEKYGVPANQACSIGHAGRNAEMFVTNKPRPDRKLVNRVFNLPEYVPVVKSDFMEYENGSYWFDHFAFASNIFGKGMRSEVFDTFAFDGLISEVTPAMVIDRLREILASAEVVKD